MGLNLFGWAFLLGSPRAVVNHPRWGSSPCLRLGHRGCRPADLDLYCFFLHLVTLFWVGGWASPPPRGVFWYMGPLMGHMLTARARDAFPGWLRPRCHPTSLRNSAGGTSPPYTLTPIRIAGPAATGSCSGVERPEREPRHRRRFAIKQPHFPKSP